MSDDSADDDDSAMDTLVRSVPTPSLERVAVPTVEVVNETRFMTGTQQFWLAMSAQFIAMVVGIVTLWIQQQKTKAVAETTHVLVNSELSAFKRLLGETAIRDAVEARAQGVREGRDDEQAANPPRKQPSDNVRVAVAEAREDDAKANLAELTGATEDTVEAAERADTIAKKRL